MQPITPTASFALGLVFVRAVPARLEGSYFDRAGGSGGACGRIENAAASAGARIARRVAVGVLER